MTTVINLTPTDDDKTVRVVFQGTLNGSFHVRANVALDSSGSAALPAALPLLMSVGSEGEFTKPTEQSVEAVDTIVSLLTSWYPHLNKTTTDGPNAEARQLATNRGVGSFFSGGVDSFYTTISKVSNLTHLIFVKGFDISLRDEALAITSLEGARSAARDLNKTLIEVETDLRDFTDPIADWGKVYHGAAMATIGLLLGRHLHTVYIPASYYDDDLFPWGSHPDLDHLWSTANTTFIHHGSDTRRTAKIAAIAPNDTAMDHLRVCWENRNGMFNCGKCEKCVRTMISLYAVGALDRCKTLPSATDLHLRIRHRPTHGSAVFARENLEALRASSGSDPKLERALKHVMRTAPWWESLRRVRRSIQQWRRT